MKIIDADSLIKWLNDTYYDKSKPSWNFDHHTMAMDMIEILEKFPAVKGVKNE